MLISNSIQDGIISHDQFLEILKEKKEYDSLKNEDKTKTAQYLIYKDGFLKTYCENKTPKVLKTINGRRILRSMCSVCNNKKSRFISKNEGSGLLSYLGIRSPVS